MASETRPLHLHRIPWLQRGVRPLLAWIAAAYRLQVKGAAHLPRTGPALLLVKHRATRDTLLLAWALGRYADRGATFLMKQGAAGLPSWLLAPFGALPVIRAKDVLRLRQRAARAAALQEARARRARVMAYVAWLYAQGELVVVYPEGMLYPDRLGPIDTGALRQVQDLARSGGPGVPIVPVGVAYPSARRAVLRVGAALDPGAFASVAPLAQAVKRQLATLSGLPPDDKAPAS